MKKAQAKNDKRLSIARTMPPLRRKKPDKPYSPENDEVIKWLVQHPDLLNYLFERLKVRGHIIFDKSSGNWQGADYCSGGKL